MSKFGRFSYFVPEDVPGVHTIGLLADRTGQLYMSHQGDPLGRDAKRALFMGTLMQPVFGDLALPVIAGARSGNFLTPYVPNFQTMLDSKNFIAYTPDQLIAGHLPYVLAALKVAGDHDLHGGNIRRLPDGRFGVFDYDQWGHHYPHDVDHAVAVPGLAKELDYPDERFSGGHAEDPRIGPHHWPGSRAMYSGSMSMCNWDNSRIPTALSSLYHHPAAIGQQYKAFVLSLALPTSYTNAVKSHVVEEEDDLFTERLYKDFLEKQDGLEEKLLNSSQFRAQFLSQFAAFERHVQGHIDAYNATQTDDSLIKINLDDTAAYLARLHERCLEKSRELPMTQLPEVEQLSHRGIIEKANALVAWRQTKGASLDASDGEACQRGFDNLIQQFISLVQRAGQTRSHLNDAIFEQLKRCFDVLSTHADQLGYPLNDLVKGSFKHLQGRYLTERHLQLVTYRQATKELIKKAHDPYELGKIHFQMTSIARTLAGNAANTEIFQPLNKLHAQLQQRVQKLVSRQVKHKKKSITDKIQMCYLYSLYCHVQPTPAELTTLDGKLLYESVEGRYIISSQTMMFRLALGPITPAISAQLAEVVLQLIEKASDSTSLVSIANCLLRIERLAQLGNLQLGTQNLSKMQENIALLMTDGQEDLEMLDDINPILLRLGALKADHYASISTAVDSRVYFDCEDVSEFRDHLLGLRGKLNIAGKHIDSKELMALAEYLLTQKLSTKRDVRIYKAALRVLTSLVDPADTLLAGQLKKLAFRASAIKQLFECEDQYRGFFGGHQVEDLKVYGCYPRHAAILLRDLMHPRHRSDFDPSRAILSVLDPAQKPMTAKDKLQVSVLDDYHVTKFWGKRDENVHKVYKELADEASTFNDEPAKSTRSSTDSSTAFLSSMPQYASQSFGALSQPATPPGAGAYACLSANEYKKTPEEEGYQPPTFQAGFQRF